MSATPDTAPIRDLLSPVVGGFGLIVEDVIAARQDGQPVIRVVVDLPEGTDPVGADHLADASRAVSKAMDDADPVDGQYLLEVSTPGISRELREPRHWRRVLGQRVTAKLRDGGTVTGTVSDANDEAAVLLTDAGATTIPYENVKRARPRVEFDTEE